MPEVLPPIDPEKNADKLINEAENDYKIKNNIIENIIKNNPTLSIASNQRPVLLKIIDNFPYKNYLNLPVEEQHKLETLIRNEFIKSQIDEVSTIEQKQHSL